MASITTDSGNLGAVIHSKRQTHLKWDHYWYFPAPEGLTGIDLTCKIDQTALLDGVIAKYNPGVDPETTLVTAGGVTSYEIRANSERFERYFGFSEPGVYTFVMRGLYAYVSGEKFSKIEEFHQKGSVATEYMNIFITKMHFSGPATPEQSQIASQLLAQIEQQYGFKGIPTQEKGKAKFFLPRVRKTRSQEAFIQRSTGRGGGSRKKVRRSKKTGGSSDPTTTLDPQIANARAIRKQRTKEMRRQVIHTLLIIAISIGLLVAGIKFFPESALPSVMMVTVGVYGLLVLYQAEFKYKVSGLWRFWVALALLIVVLFVIDGVFYN